MNSKFGSGAVLANSSRVLLLYGLGTDPRPLRLLRGWPSRFRNTTNTVQVQFIRVRILRKTEQTVHNSNTTQHSHFHHNDPSPSSPQANTPLLIEGIQLSSSLALRLVRQKTTFEYYSDSVRIQPTQCSAVHTVRIQTTAISAVQKFSLHNGADTRTQSRLEAVHERRSSRLATASLPGAGIQGPPRRLVLSDKTRRGTDRPCNNVTT